MKTPRNTTDAEKLRLKAEERLKKNPSGSGSPISETNLLKLIHELEVHQVELELQNEELRLAWAEAEVANDNYIRLYDFAPSGYFTLSKKSEIIELNLSGAGMLGKDRQHLKNSLFSFFVTEETKPIFRHFLEKAFISKAKESCEVTMDRAGSLPVHVFLTGVLEDKGEHCLITMVEITRLKQAQMDLRKAKEEAENSLLKYRISESDLKKAQSIAQLGSWKWSVKTGEVVWSDEMFNIFGLDKNSYSGSLGDAISKVIHPDDLHIVLPENASEFSTNKPIEYRIILPDNSIRYICAQAGETILDDSGNPLFLSGVAQNITTRKLVEIELRESNELNKSLLQTIPFGLDIVDEKGNVLFISDNFKQYFGEETLGKKCWDLYRDDKKQCSGCPLRSGITIGETKKYEARGVLGGKTFEIYHTGMIFNGQKAMLEAFMDISERKQYEQDIIIAKEHAEENDHLKSAFLANMSHEIRTPMNGILGFAGLLKEPNLNGEEQQKYIHIIEKSGARMLNIINDIIDISKIEAGLMEVDIKASNVNEQIEYIYTFFKPEVEDKGMQLFFKNSLAAKDALIETDREKIYAILTNLVKNAIKYSNEGSIEFGYTVGTHHGVSLPHESFLQFFVKDTGIGIAKDRQDAIFERFIQADVNDSHTLQGAGLGLSITKAYVELLGGKIWVDSEPGKGSTFYFTIPYNTKNQAQPNIANVVSQEDESVQMRNLKILIAEDDETSDMLISTILKKDRHEVLHVNTGNQAVAICRNISDLDLILMDISMPGINGYEATRQIRQFNKGVIIIAQTAYGLSGDREKAIESGCNDYISKPINRGELVQLIKKYFNK